MARTKFQVEVLTPEGEVFNDEVEMVSTRTAAGSIGVLANHEPVLAMLDPTELRLYTTRVRGRAVRPGRGLHADRREPGAAARGGGAPARASSIRRSCASASSRPSASSRAPSEDTEKQRVAQRDKARAEQFLRIAESS